MKYEPMIHETIYLKMYNIVQADFMTKDHLFWDVETQVGIVVDNVLLHPTKHYIEDLFYENSS